MKKKYIVTSMAIGFSILGVFSVVYAQNIVITPVGYVYGLEPVSYSAEKEYRSEMLGYKFKTKVSNEISKYKGQVYREDNETIIDVKVDSKSEDYQQYIRIIPVDASNSSSSLNLLERFIFTKHGMIEKSHQHETQVGELEVALIAFEFSIEGKNKYEVFSAFKIGDNGFIVTTNFMTNKSLSLKLEKSNSNLVDLYKIIETFKFESADTTLRIKLLPTEEIPSNLLEINKVFNARFKSTF